MVIIGIDPGLNTGLAMWSLTNNHLMIVNTYKIHEAMKIVSDNDKSIINHVIFEDARKRTWFGNAGREQLQGAGSIKRDCKIWEDFLTDLQIPFIMRKPAKGNTKLTADYFKKLTGWEGRTSNHARDAAMLCFQAQPIKTKPTFAKVC